MSVESYERDLAAWKARHGITTPGADAPDPEELMVVEDAKRKGKDYCCHCAEQFAIVDMRLITRELKHAGDQHTVPEWLIITRRQLQKVEDAWHDGKPTEALHRLAHVAACGVAAIEQNGQSPKHPLSQVECRP